MLSENDLRLFRERRSILKPQQVMNNNMSYIMRAINEKISSSRTISIYFELKNTSLKDDEILQIHNFFVDYVWRIDIQNIFIDGDESISISIEPALKDYI